MAKAGGDPQRQQRPQSKAIAVINQHRLERKWQDFCGGVFSDSTLGFLNRRTFCHLPVRSIINEGSCWMSDMYLSTRQRGWGWGGRGSEGRRREEEGGAAPVSLSLPPQPVKI